MLLNIKQTSFSFPLKTTLLTYLNWIQTILKQVVRLMKGLLCGETKIRICKIESMEGLQIISGTWTFLLPISWQPFGFGSLASPASGGDGFWCVRWGQIISFSTSIASGNHPMHSCLCSLAQELASVLGAGILPLLWLKEHHIFS